MKQYCDTGVQLHMYILRYRCTTTHVCTWQVWDLRSRRCVARLVGHLRPVTALAVGEGDVLYSGSVDTTVRCWDLEAR